MPRSALLALTLLIVLAAAAPAGATYPDENGRFAATFSQGDGR